MNRDMTGAEMVVQALKDQGVDTVFGYPGGAVLPIYDAIFQQNDIRHILVRHEQAAAHAAEGYARSTGKPGVVLVTSGPGATNAVTGMTDALDGFDPDRGADRAGPDLHDRQRRLPGGRHRRHHPALHQAQLAGQGHREARRDHPPGVPRRDPRPARAGAGRHPQGRPVRHRALHPAGGGAGHRTTSRAPRATPDAILAAVEALERAERPVIYSGGGVINSGREASRLLRELADATGFPITSTLMGLGAYPATGKAWIGMLGMHGTYEANWAMHDCDFMLCIGARFDDRITGRTDAFSPGSFKVHDRHRPLVDQQEHPRPGADRRRRRLGARRHAGALEGARVEDPLRGGRASGGGRSSSGAGGTASPTATPTR